MKSIAVGVGDCRLSRDPDSALVTYALGSCIAVLIHDAVARVGGLLHFMLPESGQHRAKAQQNPYMFADSGIPLLFHSAYELGAEKRRLVVTAVGGAQMIDPQGMFNIGKRNCLAMRKIFWRAGILLHAEHVGGTSSRTVSLEVSTGRIVLHGLGERREDLQPSALLGRSL